ncbi:MAG: ATP-binding protein [Leptospiraceae bacterium]|nr:ATP-binding protein [Leptospiraceae bacterium]
MVFLGGPRQVGKTTLAQSLIKSYKDGHPAYLNWDFLEHQKKIKEREWPKSEKLIVLDEIHKFKNWRNLLKGFYDTLKNSHSFLVTGSARLDHFRKGGDSLLGRYHYYRLHPYTLNEVGNTKENLERLFQFGGFPESFHKAEERFLRRWHLERINKLIKIDLRDLENVQQLDKIQLLAEDLPNRISSPLSFKSLAEDLSIDFKTCKRWIQILDSLYYAFTIPPFGAPKIRAVKKEQKLYLHDFSQVENKGARFENMVACHLLKYCNYLEDVEGYKMELRYLRDTDGREVDFVVMKDKKPIFAVECKLSEKNISKAIPYFKNRTKIPKFYQVHMDDSETQISDCISILPFRVFCKIEKLV